MNDSQPFTLSTTLSTTMAMSAASNQSAMAVVIDVRSAGEFAAGHVAGAIHLPLDQLAQRAATELPDHERPIVLYCLSGVRSGMAAQWLLAQGYRQVRNGGSVSSVALQLGRAIERG